MKKNVSLIILLLSQLYVFGQSHNCVTIIDYGNNKEKGKFAEINGIKVYYETYGKATNPSLLLIHGNGGSVASGKCQIEHFKADYFVVVADNRYQGKSGKGSEELTYELMANDYYKLLNHLGLDSVNIIGQSDGAIIGLLLAIEYPSKVKKLIAAAPNLRPDATAIHQWAIDDIKSESQKVDAKINAGDSSKVLIKQKALLTLLLNRPNISSNMLKKIKAPVLLVFGDNDYMTFDHIIEIYQNIAKANLFIVPAAGHRTYRLEPDLFNQMAERFFNNPFRNPSAKDGY